MLPALRPFTRDELPLVDRWFRDPDTRCWLGGPEWPAEMLALADSSVGTEFRGALQTGAYRYLAWLEESPVGYIDCGTFDRCTVYAGEGPEGPIITEEIDAPTGSIALAVDPELRGLGLGRAILDALLREPELAFVELFEAGVEPDNAPSRHCFQAAGFRLRSPEPDFEGMLYYWAWRGTLAPQS
jgi:RimJ/RimL family protein N-acetyltransferase